MNKHILTDETLKQIYGNQWVSVKRAMREAKEKKKKRTYRKKIDPVKVTPEMIDAGLSKFGDLVRKMDQQYQSASRSAVKELFIAMIEANDEPKS